MVASLVLVMTFARGVVIWPCPSRGRFLPASLKLIALSKWFASIRLANRRSYLVAAGSTVLCVPKPCVVAATIA